MPFLLAPNTWHRFSRSARLHPESAERAHGDGVLVDFDSPEAFEEAFWRVHRGADYIRNDRLVPVAIGPDTEADFAEYVSLILCGAGADRYLSKNNNNVLRLATIGRTFPESTIVIPFRQPASQAGSLLHQHQNFLSRHAADSFARDYMSWLAHHEFGADHRPFVFDDAELEALSEYDPASDIRYWLRLWTNVYRYTLRTAPADAVFLSYEHLCNSTDSAWPALCERLDLECGPCPVTLQRSQKKGAVDDGAEPGEAEEVHAALLEREATFLESGE